MPSMGIKNMGGPEPSQSSINGPPPTARGAETRDYDFLVGLALEPLVLCGTPPLGAAPPDPILILVSP